MIPKKESYQDLHIRQKQEIIFKQSCSAKMRIGKEETEGLLRMQVSIEKLVEQNWGGKINTKKESHEDLDTRQKQ